MTEHTREALARLGARARRAFSHAHMSDTKWRKLLCALDEAGFGRAPVIVQLIDCAEPRVMTLPTRADLWPPRPWVDSMSVGPFELRAIAWLELPIVPQDVARARTALEALGRFPLEETERGLRVLGYSGPRREAQA